MKEMKSHSIIQFLFGILLIIFYQAILPKLYFSFFQDILKGNNIFLTNGIYIGYYLIIVILLILIFHKTLKEEWIKFWNNKKLCIKEGFSAWLKGILLMIISNIIVLSITGSLAANESQNREILTELPIYAITIMCLIGPFIEEMIFRKSFRSAFQNKYLYVFMTSFIFASLHVLNSFDPFTWETLLTNWKQLFFLIPYSSLAIFFALSYWKTNSIFTSTIAHCFHNTITVAIILLSGFIGMP